MGCFQETCGLSNLPIYEGDEVVMILLDEKRLEAYTKNSYDYPTFGKFTQASYYNMFLGTLHGTYDDYGWIKKIDKKQYFIGNNLPPCIFFHKRIWDWALSQPEAGIGHTNFLNSILDEQRIFLKHFPEDLKYAYLKDGKLYFKPEILELDKIFTVADQLRRNVLSGLHFSGHQENDITKDTKLEFLNLQIEIVNKEDEVDN